MKVIDISNYKKKPKSQDPYGSPLERCIACGEMTDIPVNLPISERKTYVPGAGQLCEKCCVELYGTKDLRSLDSDVFEMW